MSEIILSVRDLKKYFPIKAGVLQKTVGHVKAVDGVSFDIVKGETLGIVGESGCGKSTTGRAIIRLFEKTGGDVYFNGKEVHSLNHKELRAIRPKMQMIFQDPYSSLNPRMTVGQIVGEALLDHGIITDKVELRKKVMKTIEECGLASYHIDRYPHEFSGGQRQRIGIARALALDPDFIIADEPVSALDVSIQAQIINLLMDLQKERGFTYLFISHDLSVVEHISTRVGVMYLGSMVELANKKDMYKNPLHPYTKALMAAIPIPDPDTEEQKKRIRLEGEIPSPVNPKPGCRFVTRCRYATEKCHQETPQLEELKPEHFVACHRAKELMEDHPQE